MSYQTTAVGVPVGNSQAATGVSISVGSGRAATGVNIPATAVAAAALAQPQQQPAPAVGIQRNAMGDIELRKYYSPTLYRSFTLPIRSQEALEAAFEAAGKLYPDMVSFNPFTGEVGLEGGTTEDLGNNNAPEAADAVRAWKRARAGVAEFFGIWISSLPKYQPGEAGPVNGRAVTAMPHNNRCQKLANAYAGPEESFAAITAIAEEVNPGHAPDVGIRDKMLTSAYRMVTVEKGSARDKEKQYQNRRPLQESIARASESPILLSWGLQIYLQNKEIAVSTNAAAALRRKLEEDLLAQRRDKPTNIFKKAFYKVRDRIRSVHGEELSSQEKEWIEAIVAQAIPKDQRKQVLRNLKIKEPQDTLLEHLIMPALLNPQQEEVDPGEDPYKWTDVERKNAFYGLPERFRTQHHLAADDAGVAAADAAAAAAAANQP